MFERFRKNPKENPQEIAERWNEAIAARVYFADLKQMPYRYHCIDYIKRSHFYITIDNKRENRSFVFIDELPIDDDTLKRTAVVVTDSGVAGFGFSDESKEWLPKEIPGSALGQVKRAGVFPTGQETWLGRFPVTDDVLNAYETSDAVELTA